MLFQKLQVGLLAPLPLGNLLERIDIPPDEFRESRRTVLGAYESSRVLKRHFAMLCPRLGGGAMSKGLCFLMDDRLSYANSDDSGVSRGAVGRLPHPAVSHSHLRGDTV